MFIIIDRETGRAFRLKGEEVPEKIRNEKGLNIIDIRYGVNPHNLIGSEWHPLPDFDC